MRLPCCRCVGGGYRATGLIATSTSGSTLSEMGRSYRWEWGKSWWNFYPPRFRRVSGDSALQCDGIPTNHVGRIGEALGGFEFALSVNDLRATFLFASA